MPRAKLEFPGVLCLGQPLFTWAYPVRLPCRFTASLRQSFFKRKSKNLLDIANWLCWFPVGSMAAASGATGGGGVPRATLGG